MAKGVSLLGSSDAEVTDNLPFAGNVEECIHEHRRNAKAAQSEG